MLLMPQSPTGLTQGLDSPWWWKQALLPAVAFVLPPLTLVGDRHLL